MDRFSLSVIRAFFKWGRKWGMVSALENLLRWLQGADLVAFRIPSFPAPIFVRPNGSDLETFEQVWLQEQYRLPDEIAVATIVDAGANIGLASLYFARTYPDAKIVSIEPESANVSLLRKNVERIPNVEIVEGALWPTNTPLSIANPSAESWSFQVSEISDGWESGIPAVTMMDVIARFPGGRIDFCKIDIEGAELELFNHPEVKWLECVRVLVVETHDRKRPGTAKAVFDAVRDRRYDCHISGDNFVIIFRD